MPADRAGDSRTSRAQDTVGLAECGNRFSQVVEDVDRDGRVEGAVGEGEVGCVPGDREGGRLPQQGERTVHADHAGGRDGAGQRLFAAADVQNQRGAEPGQDAGHDVVHTRSGRGELDGVPHARAVALGVVVVIVGCLPHGRSPQG